MKKVCCFLIATACILLAACAPTKNIVVANEKYVIYTENGNYYMQFKDTAQTGVSEVFIELPRVMFDSLEEMKSDILTGNFTKEEWKEFDVWNSLSYRRPISNLDQLLTPVYPESFDKFTVEWHFSFCEFHLEDTNSGIKASIQRLSQDALEMHIERLQTWQDYLASSYVDTPEDVRIESEEERNATAYYWTLSGGEEIKTCIYTFEKDGELFYVREAYSLGGGEREPSAETPYKVTVYAKYNGQAYCVTGTGFTERPSIEWLTSFGMVPYVED